MNNFLIFDLDGTLTDPFEGITRSVQIALENLGIIVEDRTKLKHFIGPPLKQCFAQTYNLTNEEAEKALCEYRKYFSVKGIFENMPYDGIYECLECLSKKAVLILATSKPLVFAEKILDKFELKKYFTAIYGSNLDGSKVEKHELIADAMKEQCIDTGRTFMIGDRCFDIDGAKKNGIKSIGVTYGYGGRDELLMAGADYTVDSPFELSELLLSVFSSND